MARRGNGSVFVLSDFGYSDEFAGVVRAVVQRCAPGAPVVDITHDIPPFDVRAGALALRRVAPHLGPGVVLAVVDPGVGGARRPVALSVSAQGGGPAFFVGPDNGLLLWMVDDLGGAARAVALPPSPRAGSGASFDGRDVFAPAAARLWTGASVDELGSPLDPATLVRLVPPHLAVAPGAVATEVLWVDRFGNAQLSARGADGEAAGLGAALAVVVGTAEHRARAVRAFGALAPGELGVMLDANGHLALVCDRRPAATVLGVRPGDLVTLRAVRAEPTP